MKIVRILLIRALTTKKKCRRKDAFRCNVLYPMNGSKALQKLRWDILRRLLVKKLGVVYAVIYLNDLFSINGRVGYAYNLFYIFNSQEVQWTK